MLLTNLGFPPILDPQPGIWLVVVMKWAACTAVSIFAEIALFNLSLSKMLDGLHEPQFGP